MVKKQRLTRSERRSRRAEIPDSRVYGVEIRDAGAQSWSSIVIVHATTSNAAETRFRQANIHKRVILRLLRYDEIDQAGSALAAAKPGVLFISQHGDGGWSEWMELPSTYEHPSQGLAAKHPELRWPPP